MEQTEKLKKRVDRDREERDAAAPKVGLVDGRRIVAVPNPKA
jgi:hypothetical protein